MRAGILASAYLLDWLVGDPEGWPHPVRGFGACIAQAERIMRHPQDTAGYELIAGSALAVALPVAAGYVSFLGLRGLLERLPLIADGIEILLAETCLATRNLIDEAGKVIKELESGSLATARISLSRIVGRDTATLDEAEICRAVIETLAESLSDGIIAPLFYLALGGTPAALAYKSINTMDSMIGHKDQRYFYFGKAAARLDDLANFLPARLSALLICTSSIFFSEVDGGRAWKVWLRDGDKHKSPNAGQPESAMAGALNVRLGGKNFYDGEMVEAPVMGQEFLDPSIHQAKTAIRITAMASILGCAAALVFLWRRSQ